MNKEKFMTKINHTKILRCIKALIRFEIAEVTDKDDVAYLKLTISTVINDGP